MTTDLAQDRQRERHVVDAATMRAAIDASGLTHREIARRLKVAEKTIWRYANGKSLLEIWTWPLFLDLIGLGTDWRPSTPDPAVLARATVKDEPQ